MNLIDIYVIPQYIILIVIILMYIWFMSNKMTVFTKILGDRKCTTNLINYNAWSGPWKRFQIST